MGSRVIPSCLLTFFVLMLLCSPCHAIPVFNDDFSGLDNWTVLCGNVSASDNAMIITDSGLVAFSPLLIIGTGNYRISFDYTADVSREPDPPEDGIIHDFWSFTVALYNLADFEETSFDPSAQLQSNSSRRFDWIFTNSYNNAYFSPIFYLSNENGISDDSNVRISNFSVVTVAEPVPEPGTILLMGAGGLALALARRFMHKARERSS